MAKKKPKPKPVDPAVQYANQALAPVLAEIQRQQAEERKRAAQAQQAARDRSAGLAEVLGGIAPQTQATYQAAGDSTAAYAKGFSAAFAGDSQAAASGLNDIIARTGAPGAAQVQAAGSNGGDVLYGLGGYIPASGLVREGAAFTAAAQGLPATARLQGQAQAGQIGKDSRDKLAELNALLRGEKAKLPGMIQDARSQLADQKLKERAAKLNELIAVENLGIRKDQLGISQQNANTSRLNTQLRAEQQRFNQLLGKAKLDLSQDEFGLAIQRERRLSKLKAKGGFTAKQKQDLSQTAFESATDAFDAGMKPVDVLRDLIAAGVPFSFAIRAIQRQAKKAGAPDNWKATLGWTKPKRGKKK